MSGSGAQVPKLLRQEYARRPGQRRLITIRAARSRSRHELTGAPCARGVLRVADRAHAARAFMASARSWRPGSDTMIAVATRSAPRSPRGVRPRSPLGGCRSRRAALSVRISSISTGDNGGQREARSTRRPATAARGMDAPAARARAHGRSGVSADDRGRQHEHDPSASKRIATGAAEADRRGPGADRRRRRHALSSNPNPSKP